MDVYYDHEVDALYIELGEEIPDGVVELEEGVNLDTTSDNKIVGLEILNASKKYICPPSSPIPWNSTRT